MHGVPGQKMHGRVRGHERGGAGADELEKFGIISMDRINKLDDQVQPKAENDGKKSR
jgi:hypothetical protein